MGVVVYMSFTGRNIQISGDFGCIIVSIVEFYVFLCVHVDFSKMSNFQRIPKMSI